MWSQGQDPLFARGYSVVLGPFGQQSHFSTLVILIFCFIFIFSRLYTDPLIYIVALRQKESLDQCSFLINLKSHTVSLPNLFYVFLSFLAIIYSLYGT